MTSPDGSTRCHRAMKKIASKSTTPISFPMVSYGTPAQYQDDTKKAKMTEVARLFVQDDGGDGLLHGWMEGS